MNISWTRFTIAASAALALAAGCSGNGTPSAGLPPGSAGAQTQSNAHRPIAPNMSAIALTTSERIVPTIHTNPNASWMSPEAKHTQYLLYVSDEAAGSVNVYAYKKKAGKLLGQLTGFQFPYGDCIDNSGNVYITDFAAGQIVEFSHGGTTPVQTLADPYGDPIGCSVDPTTGNLAVGNFSGAGSTCMGGVVVYADATGTGTLYQDKDFDYYWPPGYDNQGNLFIQGRKKHWNRGKTGIAELAAGTSTLMTVSLSGGKIEFPGGMQWDGHYMTATDQRFQGTRDSGIYRVTVSAAKGQIVGSTPLTDTECMKTKASVNDVVEPFINGTARPDHAVVAGNLACSYRYDFWNYIKGGDPKRTLPYNLAPELASGQTVSPMKR
jgi:hypothetical protein